VLDQKDYQIADTILSFETPECLQDTKDLEIVIDKQNMKDWIVIWTRYHSHGIFLYKFSKKKRIFICR
jgi:hypothetical protein